MQFLALIETIAANLTASNITNFIDLVEGLVSLGENMLEHTASTPASTATTSSSTPPTAS